MTRSRTDVLSRRKLRLKNAFLDLVDEFGGQVAVAAHWSEKTGRVIRQQWISDLCHRNIDEFPPVDLIAELEAHLHGSVGHPHVTRALAGLQDFALVTVAAVPGQSDLVHHLTAIAGESGDVLRALTDLLEDGAGGLEKTARRRARMQAVELFEAAGDLVARLDGKSIDAVVGIDGGKRGRG